MQTIPNPVRVAYTFLNETVLEEASDNGRMYDVVRTFLMSVESYDYDYFDDEVKSSIGQKAINEVRDAVGVLVDDGVEGREYLTALRLAYSLCPLHAIDYAICFDDDDVECAGIRIVHPGHDS